MDSSGHFCIYHSWFNVVCDRSLHLMNKCRTSLELFYAIWFVMGNVWVFDSRFGSFRRAPKLHVLCISLLAWNAISYSFPFLLFLLLCCIVPTVSTILGYNMNMGSVDRGASDEQISKLPSWRYKEADRSSLDTGDGTERNSDDPVSVNMEIWANFSNTRHLNGLHTRFSRNAAYASQNTRRRKRWGSCRAFICFTRSAWINGSGSYLAVLCANKSWRDSTRRPERARERVIYIVLSTISYALMTRSDLYLYVLAWLREWGCRCKQEELTSNHQSKQTGSSRLSLELDSSGSAGAFTVKGGDPESPAGPELYFDTCTCFRVLQNRNRDLCEKKYLYGLACTFS